MLTKCATRRLVAVGVGVGWFTMTGVAQDANSLYLAGKYQEVVAATAGTSNPSLVYLTAQSHQKLEQGDKAGVALAKLTARGESDPWRFVGESALRLARGDAEGAFSAATRAVELGAGLSQAHFQLGLTCGHKQDFAKAAESFNKAAELDPSSAYAHYYAGLSYYRVNRVDRMATHFEAFLRLAPAAPERGEVESIMRTIRGR